MGPSRCDAALMGNEKQARAFPSSAHFGGILIPPSTRTTSAFMYELVTSSTTIEANSSGLPRRCGNSTHSPSFALKASDPFAFTVDRRIDEAGRDGIDPNSDCHSQRQVAVIFFCVKWRSASRSWCPETIIHETPCRAGRLGWAVVLMMPCSRQCDV